MWNYRIQRQYRRAREQVNQNLRKVSHAQVRVHKEGVVDHKID